MVLLNLNRAGGPSKPGPVSRGMIIPSLIHCATVESALAEACALRPAQYDRFRLVMLDRQALAQIDSNGRNLRATREPLLDVPILFTSSGLGDELVEPVRRELFEQMVQVGGASPETQDAFHRYHWGNRPHLSVCMRRSDARTVSHSIVELHPDVVRFRYHPAAPDESADDHVIELSTHTLAPA
jgi:hypothetical protein